MLKLTGYLAMKQCVSKQFSPSRIILISVTDDYPHSTFGFHVLYDKKLYIFVIFLNSKVQSFYNDLVETCFLLIFLIDTK